MAGLANCVTWWKPPFINYIMAENTSQAASVRVVRHRRTRSARGRLQKLVGKARKGFFDSLKLPHRGSWQGAALTEEGRGGREHSEKGMQATNRSRPQHPSSINYGIAATGSYRRFDSLRDAPPLRRSPFPGGEG